MSEQTTFKTAEQLGIPEEHRCALVKTMDALAKGEIQHINESDFNTPINGSPTLFNMNNWSNQYKCGSVCCIGGTAELLGKTDKVEFGDYEGIKGLHNLFYPDNIVDWDRITPELAVKAIQNYLQTGEPNWLKVMGED